MLTETGYRRRTYDEILNDKIAKARELFGEDIDTSESSNFGKYIRINAYDQSISEEDAENIYYSISPNTATGQNLDRLCPFVGISRNQATYARFNVVVTGTYGYVVPVGFEVGTDEEITYYNVSEKTIDVSGTVSIVVECTQAGDIGNVSADKIDRVMNPDANITSIEGLSQEVYGEEVESDYSLRKRFADAVSGSGGCSEAALKSAVLRVPTVSSVGMIVNATDETVDGRPARSFEVYVGGGENYHSEIAKTIFEHTAAGIGTFGSVETEIIDDGGTAHTIKFSHTENLTVYVRATVNTKNEFDTDNGSNNIKDNIREYINNLGIGTSLVTTSLYGYIYSVGGIASVTTLEVSTNGTTWSTSDITAENYQACKLEQFSIKLDNGSYEVV